MRLSVIGEYVRGDTTKKDKNIINYLHASRRALERYDVSLLMNDIKNIITLIQNGHAKFIKRTSRARAIFVINYMEKDMFVIYDRTRKSIVTFLPPTDFELMGDDIENYEKL